MILHGPCALFLPLESLSTLGFASAGPGIGSWLFMDSLNVFFSPALQDQYHSLHFIDEKTEDPPGFVTCSRSHKV